MLTFMEITSGISPVATGIQFFERDLDSKTTACGPTLGVRSAAAKVGEIDGKDQTFKISPDRTRVEKFSGSPNYEEFPKEGQLRCNGVRTVCEWIKKDQTYSCSDTAASVACELQ